MTKRSRRAQQFLLHQMHATVVMLLVTNKRRRLDDGYDNHHDNHRTGTVNRIRERRTIENIYNQLGPTFFRRSFRMEYEDFLRLWQLLEEGIEEMAGNTREWGPNGRVPTDVRLGCAIRYFAGGCVYDLMIQFGVSASTIYSSIWIVVDAVRKCQALQISYPENMDDQYRIAEGYRLRSRAGFDQCAGAIDGLLVWINKPTKKQCEEANTGQMKFYCGRKNKYALNMQAVCDHNSRFLDVSIMYGGASSDLIAFEASTLYDKLEHDNLLAPGLCIFGDNAYVNSHFLATPYPGNVTPEQDAYNFFHSQLRITSECSFGRHINRWGSLQKKIPQNFSIVRTIAYVLALCQLSNYCTDASMARRAGPDPPRQAVEDVANIRLNGGLPFHQQYRQEIEQNVRVPLYLMDGGHQGEEGLRHVRRNRQRRIVDDELPREQLCRQVTEQNLRRPALRDPNPNPNNNL